MDATECQYDSVENSQHNCLTEDYPSISYLLYCKRSITVPFKSCNDCYDLTNLRR